jgi:hypothetical protein
MGIVMKELLAHTPILALPIGALLLFIAVFVAIVVRTMARKATTYADVAQLAVGDDDDDSQSSQSQGSDSEGAHGNA